MGVQLLDLSHHRRPNIICVLPYDFRTGSRYFFLLRGPEGQRTNTLITMNSPPARR